MTSHSLRNTDLIGIVSLIGCDFPRDPMKLGGIDMFEIIFIAAIFAVTLAIGVWLYFDEHKKK
jgi:hypothetical protein